MNTNGCTKEVERKVKYCVYMLNLVEKTKAKSFGIQTVGT